jgi:hypothetical protein
MSNIKSTNQTGGIIAENVTVNGVGSVATIKKPFKKVFKLENIEHKEDIRQVQILLELYKAIGFNITIHSAEMFEKVPEGLKQYFKEEL